MNTKLLPWIIAGIFLVWAVIATTCSGSDDQNDKIVELQTKIDIRDVAIHELSQKDVKRAEKQRQDSIREAEKDKVHVAKEKKWMSQIARMKANPIVIKVREQNPEIDSLIHKQDSVIAEQGERLYESGKYVTQLQIEMTEIRRDFNERIAQQELNFLDQKAISDDYRKQLRKERRKGKFAKILIPVVAVGAFLAGSSL